VSVLPIWEDSSFELFRSVSESIRILPMRWMVRASCSALASWASRRGG